jgi:hypothetical protein
VDEEQPFQKSQTLNYQELFEDEFRNKSTHSNLQARESHGGNDAASRSTNQFEIKHAIQYTLSMFHFNEYNATP